jgi:hypothetical protein
LSIWLDVGVAVLHKEGANNMNVTIAVILNDQFRPTGLIIAPVAKLQIRPLSPPPADAMPFARPLRRVNHCETIPAAPIYWNPHPHPKSAPWVR